jgi:hypothetical protein
MGLQSKSFKGDPALDACLVSDRAHIVPGAVGAHVGKIQQALIQLDSARIDSSELVTQRYGSSTAAAVLAFKTKRNIINRNYQTKPDNIVGKMTIAALDAELLRGEPPSGPLRSMQFCENGNPANRALAMIIQTQFIGSLEESVAAGGTSTSARSSLGIKGLSGRSAFRGFSSLLPSFKSFAGSPQDTANVRSRFGGSIDFSTVFISNKTGLQGRAFTIGFSLPGGVGVVQVMNLGSSPSEPTVIHEMAHVWQSQHHPDPRAFDGSCVLCQKEALKLNVLESQWNQTLVGKTGFPANFPNSAYAYRQGNPFRSYGGEQIAQQVQNNETAIVSHISSVSPGAVDADNVASLKNTSATEDRRLAGVFI